MVVARRRLDSFSVFVVLYLYFLYIYNGHSFELRPQDIRTARKTTNTLSLILACTSPQLVASFELDRR